ncbi:SUKH-4 family immunity protein [Kitasatospora sp. NPDC088346]|uniref:SUKH-4 family immunity protein n=1 Tax=Kitasatospora sp. NPDC088346 TaxID=3364073 RepID=UPI003822E97F
MVTTYAQAQETAEEWINGGVPRSQHREVRVREFDLGFVCWADDRAEGPAAEGGGPRLVITRDSGASTLWPPLPVNEVVRQFEERYGSRSEPNPAGAARPVPGAVEATSFLLSPPQWFEQAGADALAAEAAELAAQTAAVTPAPAPAPAAPAPLPEPAHLSEPPASDRPAGDAPTMLAPPPSSPGSEGLTVPMPGGYGLGAPPVPAANSEGLTVALPGPVGPAAAAPVPADATMPMPEGFLTGAPDLSAAPPPPPGFPPPAAPPGPPAPPVPSIEHAATMLATPDGPLGGPAPAAPQGPSIEYAPTMLASDGPPGLMGLPGAPGVPGGPVPGVPAPGLGRSGPAVPPPPPPTDLGRGPAGGGAAPGVPTGRNAPTAPPPPAPADLHGSAAGRPGAGGRVGAGAPPPPVPTELNPGAARPAAEPPRPAASEVAYQATQLATPAVDLSAGGPPLPPPPPPGAVPSPGAPPVGYGYPVPGGVPAPAPVMAPPAVPQGVQPPPAPAAPGTPAIGPGTQAVVSYRGPDGSEQTLLHRSEPGTPHPEWKALQDLRALNVPPDQVLELHTDLELCDLPGGYCARMVKASWPNVRISHTVPYGRDQRARQAGMAQLNDHLDQLHQLAAAPQRPRPVRVPLPAPGMIPQLPPLAPQQLAGELGQAFGPGVFRFEQRAVARQGVPEPVSQTLMWAGLPREFAPFFWAQAQEGRPIPTLAELAAERGRPAAPDFGGYLVLGNDYGRQLCVQYGTAAVVAVDLDGSGEAPRFVNTGVPEFVRSLAVLGRMWRLRYGLTPEQAGRWTTDLQAQLIAVDPAALYTPESWWAVLVEQFWDGLM